MTVKLIKDGLTRELDEDEFPKLKKFGESLPSDLIFEWEINQFWLHSDVSKERPVGIEIDQDLLRHEEYFKRSSIHKELLGKAIGIKGSYRPKVLDLTAGLLGDSLLLLSYGCEVWAVERHPVVQFLIQSALQTAIHPKLKNFHFLPMEAHEALASLEEFDVIYFDPMFEDANEKTAPRKQMRIFRNLIGSDSDAIDVFKIAKASNFKRLVIKRPRRSLPLAANPSVEYIGKSTRYDVYFSHQKV